MKMPARFSVVAFQVAAFGADHVRRARGEGGEGDPVLLVGLLHAGGLEVLQDHLREGSASRRSRRWSLPCRVSISSSSSSTPSTRCGLRLSTVKGPATRTHLLVLVGLVVEVLELGLGGDGGVDLLLPGDARLPPVGVQLLRRSRDHLLRRPRAGISHSCQVLLERGVQLGSRSGSSFACHCVPDDVDLGVVGDGFERDVRHALIDEAVADVAVHGLRTGRGAGDFGFLDLALAANRPAGSTDSARP